MASTYISLPSASSSTITGPIDVNVTASNDSIRISDGTDTLAVNADGSLNVVATNIGTQNVLLTGENRFTFGEVTNLAVGGSSNLVSQFFATEHKLRRVSCTGENIGIYTIRFNTTDVDKKRSTYTNFNCEFDYETGITIPANTTVVVEAENSGTTVAAFSAQILYSDL